MALLRNIQAGCPDDTLNISKQAFHKFLTGRTKNPNFSMLAINHAIAFCSSKVPAENVDELRRHPLITTTIRSEKSVITEKFYADNPVDSIYIPLHALEMILIQEGHITRSEIQNIARQAIREHLRPKLQALVESYDIK